MSGETKANEGCGCQLCAFLDAHGHELGQAAIDACYRILQGGPVRMVGYMLVLQSEEGGLKCVWGGGAAPDEPMDRGTRTRLAEQYERVVSDIAAEMIQSTRKALMEGKHGQDS